MADKQEVRPGFGMTAEDKAFRDTLAASYAGKQKTSISGLIAFGVFILTLFFIVPTIIGMVSSGFLYFSDISVDIIAIIIAALIFWVSINIPASDIAPTQEGGKETK